jgi:hypothetical protein
MKFLKIKDDELKGMIKELEELGDISDQPVPVVEPPVCSV